jgi:hypothetical protein
MSRIRQSTIHSFKGLEEETAIILDALDSSAPLLHPSWVFNRVFGQDLPQLIEEERRLFYVAMTRAKHDLCILTSTGRQTWEVDEAGGRPSPFLGEIRQNGYSLAALDWFSLPPVVGTRNGHVVQVHNQTGKGVLPTVEIKDQLKAARFQYEGDNYKFWTSPVIKGSIESLRQAPWALAADGIEVRKIDALGSTLARYAVNSGQWVCLESLDPMSRPTLG